MSKHIDSGSNTVRKLLPSIERVQLISYEMREMADFQKSVREIEEARSRGADQSIKRRLKVLIDRLLDNPSERTLYYFIELRERWGLYIDPFPILEQRWGSWVTLEQRIQLMRQKYGSNPQGLEFIDDVEDAIPQLDLRPFRTSLSGWTLASLVAKIVDCCPNCCVSCDLAELMRRRRLAHKPPYIQYRLQADLLVLLKLRYGLTTNVNRIIKGALERQKRRRATLNGNEHRSRVAGTHGGSNGS